MTLYKSCPKCSGDLGMERDISGGPPDLVCIQCGYTARPQERVMLLSRLIEARRLQLARASARSLRWAS